MDIFPFLGSSLGSANGGISRIGTATTLFFNSIQFIPTPNRIRFGGMSADGNTSIQDVLDGDISNTYNYSITL